MLILQKIVGSFAELPGLLIVVLIVFFLILVRKKEKKSSLFVLILICIIWFVSTNIGLLSLVKPYEDRYSESFLSDENVENSVIVVFSGGVIRNVPYGETAYDQIGSHSMMRLYRAFEIYKITGSKIILTGGNVYEKSGRTIAEIMKDVLISWDVPENDMIIETKAKTTLENAVYSIELIPEGVTSILLVTSAIHMSRSYDSFLKVIDRLEKHYDIVPCPGDYMIEKNEIGIEDFLPNRGALNTFMSVFHEWVGNLFYLLK
ncbi:MAG TPA: YdcF family protein [Thermotogota bacterium]|nr:YdcF family protein [Thermotogota bacterium]HPJ90093.1 YdcF family protein [Thermotogota bacterium]HPR97287.1 YdcF family protein [Thermotogota bacterium]